MTYNVTISIGRNVGNDSQLSWPDWDDFVDAVEDIATGIIDCSRDAQVVQRGFVTGYWCGKEEESFTVTVAGVDPYAVLYANQTGEVNDEQLRTFFGYKLHALAEQYNQDGIAFTFYRPEFV